VAGGSLAGATTSGNSFNSAAAGADSGGVYVPPYPGNPVANAVPLVRHYPPPPPLTLLGGSQ